MHYFDDRLIFRTTRHIYYIINHTSTATQFSAAPRAQIIAQHKLGSGDNRAKQLHVFRFFGSQIGNVFIEQSNPLVCKIQSANALFLATTYISQNTQTTLTCCEDQQSRSSSESYCPNPSSQAEALLADWHYRCWPSTLGRRLQYVEHAGCVL